MYLCVRDIDIACFYDLPILFWSYYDSVIFLFYFHSIILLQVDINGDNIKTVIETVKNVTSDPGILTSIDVIAIADVLVHIPNDTLINQTVSYSSHFILQIINKRQRIPKGQSKKDNPEKLATQGTQDEE